jgi:hypothetical protein
MAIPGQSISIRDPGLGIPAEGPSAPIVLGCSSIGTVDTVYSFSNKADVVDTLGEGPLPECVCHMGDIGGWPVRAMRLTGSTAGAAGAVTKTAIGTSTGTITVAGAAFDRYSARIEIMGTGTVATGKFRYSLDGGTSFSEVLTIPSGGTYAIPRTNLTLTFVPGGGAVFFELGDFHTFSSTAPLYSTANLATGITALLASPLEFTFGVLTGEHATGAAAATMFSALDVHAASLATAFKFSRWIMDAGTDTTANAITAFAAVSSSRLAVVYGDATLSTSKAFTGWGSPVMAGLVSAAGKAHAALPSTDIARVASGSLTGVTAISHDEFRTEVLDAVKISTLRTWQGRAGFYICNLRLKSAAGSDFLYFQHGRLMDIACDTTVKSQQMMSSISVRTNSDGTIDERDALRLEKPVNAALAAVLLEPDNAEGTKGHVSALQYKIRRDNNVQTTFTIRSKVAIRPLGYAKQLVTELGFALDVGG